MSANELARSPVSVLGTPFVSAGFSFFPSVSFCLSIDKPAIYLPYMVLLLQCAMNNVQRISLRDWID